MNRDELLRLIDEAAADERTTLDLSGMGLDELPPEIGKLTNLKTLVLGRWDKKTRKRLGNNLKLLPGEIGQLTELRSLLLSYNQFSELPEVVASLDKLRSLYLASNQLTTLPEGLGQLINLRSLDLASNQLTTLPEVVGQLINLRSLHLWGNQLTTLPEVVGQLSNLQSLNLGANQLTTLPEVVGQLINLRSLNLIGNLFVTLPELVGQLSSLQSLFLMGNQLTTLPEVIGQLSNLQSLNLIFNQLTTLPEGLGQLINLRSIHLSHNQLTTLPEGLGQLINLRLLYLSHNQLTMLPEGLGQLSSLQSLDLGSNLISTFPDIVRELGKLTSLILWGNKISQLPDWTKQLTTLQRLDLRANRLPIPPEVLGGKTHSSKLASAAEVIDYYFQEKADEPLYEAKLIIVGEGKAGKTTLAQKLIDANYKLQPDEKSTEGIDILPYEFDHPDGHRCKVKIWDFGGQEIYHATHQFFLSERAVYVLVTDSRQGNTDFYFWLNAIRLHGAQSPVLLIKNEQQDRPCTVPDRQLRGEFQNLKESLETNLSTNRNLDRIKSTVEQYISNLPHVGDALPKTWAQVRSVLENQALSGRDRYISIQDYRQICCAQGIPNRNEQDRLSHFLHQLGVFLHFHKIPLLAKTIFLQPVWSTDAVYKVLGHTQVRKDCGRFSYEDLQDIWSDEQYADLRNELLALMQEFEVCYEIIGRPQHYIAPHLLEANLPSEHEYKKDWDNQNNLILSYSYPFKPKNLFPRFIVALHHYIEKQKLVWKNGVVLSIDSARAEVIEDTHYKDANIRIRISGTDKKPLLSIIGHELEKIHGSFSDLAYEMLVPCNCPECKPSQTPYQFRYSVLKNSLSKRNFEMQCQQSFKMVNVRRLIDDVIEPSVNRDSSTVSPHSEAQSGKNNASPFANQAAIAVNFPPQQYQENTTDMSTTVHQHGQGDNIAGDKVTGDKVTGDRIGTQLSSPPTPPVPKPNSATRIFLSYALKDGTEAAARLRSDLMSAGFSVWQDIEDMQGGKAWKAQLRQALREVDAVVVLLTPEAVASKYVEWEIEMAQMVEKTIFPVLVLDCEIPEELRPLHYRNLSVEENYSSELLSIIKDLNNLS